MKKINLLSRAEMKKVMGGNVAPGDGGPGPKVIACEGKKEGDPCSWPYNGGTSTGYCRSYAPDYTRHCSNLI